MVYRSVKCYVQKPVVNWRASPTVVRPTVRFSILMHFDCFSFRQALCVLIVTSYLLWALRSKMIISPLSCSCCIAVSELVYFVCFLLWVTPTAGLCDCRRTWHQKSTTMRRSTKTESLAAAQPSRHGKTSRATFEMQTTVV